MVTKMTFLTGSIFLTVLAIQVSGNVAGKDKVAAAAAPAWDVEQGLDQVYSDDVTTKRPQISDIFGGFVQGLVKAPAQIANRVQGIFDGLLRRSTTEKPIF